MQDHCQADFEGMWFQVDALAQDSSHKCVFSIPQDVLVTLLNNLKVQERQNRVCTTVAIAIVAETCAPFTVLPALMNEYRTPEINVQNGVLKALSFMFEYIGELAKDYIYAVTPLLEDALMDRDLVRDTAISLQAAAIRSYVLI
jgi:splicing factor 3B subunit 1